MSNVVRLDDRSPTPKVKIEDFGFNPAGPYEEISPSSTTVLYVGVDETGTPDVTVPANATRLMIQPIDADMRLLLDSNSLATNSFGQLFPSGAAPLSIALQPGHYITVQSSGTVGIYWGK